VRPEQEEDGQEEDYIMVENSRCMFLKVMTILMLGCKVGATITIYLVEWD
jgi:hypothetical protein